MIGNIDESKLDLSSAAGKEQYQRLLKLDAFYEGIAAEEGNASFTPMAQKILLLDFVVAGTSYCKELDANVANSILKGTYLKALREENKYDPNAIALYLDEIKIGYVPKADNAIIARLMDAGKLVSVQVNEVHKESGWTKIEASLFLAEELQIK